VSKNDFPTASGLASSASGFAALALAAVRAAGLDWDVARVADLARRSSASAARSLFGGFVELDGTTVRRVLAEDEWDVRLLVCVTTEAPKAISSSVGMRETSEKSPYYAAWLREAPAMFHALREAVASRDLRAMGALAERSALAMHACAMAAGLVYVSGATLDALACVRAMREAGLLTYATIDAGPHLKCIVAPEHAEEARARLSAVPGVLRIIATRPGGAPTLASAR
jgi:diphosphomevalonate decarboxylase